MSIGNRASSHWNKYMPRIKQYAFERHMIKKIRKQFFLGGWLFGYKIRIELNAAFYWDCVWNERHQHKLCYNLFPENTASDMFVWMTFSKSSQQVRKSRTLCKKYYMNTNKTKWYHRTIVLKVCQIMTLFISIFFLGVKLLFMEEFCQKTIDLDNFHCAHWAVT